MTLYRAALLGNVDSQFQVPGQDEHESGSVGIHADAPAGSPGSAESDYEEKLRAAEIVTLRQQLENREHDIESIEEELAAVKLQIEQCQRSEQIPANIQLAVQGVHYHQTVPSTSVCVC